MILLIMSLLIRRRLSRLGLGKAGSVRSSLLILSNGFSSSMLQTPPCSILGADRCGEEGLGKLVTIKATERTFTYLEKKVPMELVDKDAMVKIGASHGWIATLKEDGILRLQDDLNPNASDKDPKRIPLPPLVTLPRSQTQIVTNVAMSSASPEDEDCVVAVKFLGPQLSFCRPAQSNSEWTNIRIENPCFFSSRVMYSKKDDMFCIPGSGGHVIGSWDLRTDKHKPKLQQLRFQNLPELTKTRREILDSCCTSEHLVESTTTGETFLVKLYRNTALETVGGIDKLKTEAFMVFKIDEEGNAVYTKDIGDLSIFISKSEPFCATPSSFPGMTPNMVNIWDVDEIAFVELAGLIRPYFMKFDKLGTPFQIPPQNRSKGLSPSLRQTPPCSIIGANTFGSPGLGKLIISNANERGTTDLEKKVPMDLVYNQLYDTVVTIGASHGWVATLKNDGILRLQDDLNPNASDTNPKRIPLPEIITLSGCQTEIITNVSLSSSSPEDKNCLVAAKFLGPQLSICRPARPKSEWVNIRIEDPCFFSSSVMFSKKHNMFRIPGSGGHLIASWDFHKHNSEPELQRLRFQNLPELTKTKRELLDLCFTTEHLVESESTGETFLLKWYRKTGETNNGIVKMRTEAVMVFKLDEQGNAVYTQDIGDLCIFLSKSEPICVPASSFPGMTPNMVKILDADETASVDLAGYVPIICGFGRYSSPYFIPPQNIV